MIEYKSLRPAPTRRDCSVVKDRGLLDACIQDRVRPCKFARHYPQALVLAQGRS